MASVITVQARISISSPEKNTSPWFFDKLACKPVLGTNYEVFVDQNFDLGLKKKDNFVRHFKVFRPKF